MPDLTDEIETAAAEPASASVDGQSVTAQSLPDLIEADRYLKSRAAADATGSGGKRRSGFAFLRPAQFVPPGGS